MYLNFLSTELESLQSHDSLICFTVQKSAIACINVCIIVHSSHLAYERPWMCQLTMSTVTSPTFVEPWALRKFLMRSCSFGILSAKMPFKSVLSAEIFRETLVMMAGQYFCLRAERKIRKEKDEDIFKHFFLLIGVMWLPVLFTPKRRKN